MLQLEQKDEPAKSGCFALGWCKPHCLAALGPVDEDATPPQWPEKPFLCASIPEWTLELCPAKQGAGSLPRTLTGVRFFPSPPVVQAQAGQFDNA